MQKKTSISDRSSNKRAWTIARFKRSPNGWKSLVFSLAAIAAYLLIFFLLYPVIGPTVCIFAILPVIVIAHRSDMHIGLITGALSLPINAGLVLLLEESLPRLFLEGGVIGSLALVLIGAVVGHITDLSKQLRHELKERERVEEKLIEMTLYDSLTGLPNHTLFMDRLEHAIARGRRQQELYFAVLLLDLDHFTAIDDSLGHLLGNQLLIKVAQRLEEGLRSVDTIARLRADEFAILIDQVEDEGDALRIARRAQDLLSLPFDIEGIEVFVTASLGIALATSALDEPNALLRNAAIAMDRTKDNGGSQIEIFEPAMHAKAVARLKLETDLRHAIERQELQVVYQPLVTFEDGELTGFEALVRWQHPVHGLLSPTEFLPIAEASDQMITLDKWVLDQACHQLQAWRERFPMKSNLAIHVNLSGAYFKHPDLVRDVEQILKETGLCGEYLRLEISENTVVEDIASLTDLAFQLNELGVQLDIDDFGTGNSALSYLRLFPIRTLKLDHFFISRMHNGNQRDSEIIRVIITLAHRLGMEVIAEGIETSEQMADLIALGCKTGQGNLFSQPVDSKTAEVFIEVESPKNNMHKR